MGNPLCARYFTLNEISGEVTVANTPGNVIDREIIGDSLACTIQAADMCMN